MHEGVPQKLDNFYKCSNPLNTNNGRYPICKDCLNEMIDPDNPTMLFKVLKDMDVAYIPELWEKCKNLHPENPFGNYMRNVNTLQQYKGKHFDSSQTVVTEKDVAEIKAKVEKAHEESKDSSGRTPYERKKDLALFWGAGFNVTELDAMQKKYDKITESYATPTQMHVENLKRYCKYSVKEDMALAADDATAAKNWGDLASKAAQAAKLNVAQMSAADLQGGVNSFSEVVQAVESAVDIVPILNRFVYRPNDSLDLVLWEYCNYARHLKGLKDETYEDMYKFYDDKKQEYIETTGDPYGFYTDDPTASNRDATGRVVHALDGINTEENGEDDDNKPEGKSEED